MNLIKKGAADVTRYLMLLDPTTGAPETGLTITDLDLQYTRNRTAPAAKVDATALAATDSAHGDNKMIQVNATSSPGLYRVVWPDAAFASGVDKVLLVVSGAAIAPAVEEIQLVDIDVEDGVRAGLTALPDAAADAAGGLPISDAGGLDLDGRLDADVSSRAVAGDAMALENDAITAAKFDESTAYPVKSDDAGATQIARTGADSDTLETLSDQMDGLADSLGGIANTGSATNTPANSGSSIATGVVAAGTYADTEALDGSYWQLQDIVGTLDMYFEFNVGNNGIPASVKFTGRLSGANDVLDVFGWDWAAPGWKQIGSLQGKAVVTDDAFIYDLLNSMVGTGADAGKVRVRFYSTGLTSANFYTDQIFCSYSTQFSAVGYANGAIWVDTVNGTAGAVDNVNGVADLPVDNWADALTLSASLNIRRFQVAPGSSIALTGNSDNFALYGAEWTLALGGQSIANAYIEGATVSGTSAGLNARFIDCKMGTCSLTACGFGRCAISSDITLLTAGTYLWEGCFSAVAGAGTPSVDFGAALGNTNLNIRHYSGGIEVKNIGQAGIDKMSLEGFGQYVLNANCAGGDLAVRGCFKETDNAGGAVTVSEIARYSTDQVLAALTDDDTRIDASALNTLSSHDPGATIAKAGDAMTLEDDAITAAKFDESTAYPVKSDDSGATEIARTGADSDTLETLSDQIDGASTFDPATDEVDVGEVKGVGVAGVADFKADVSALALETSLFDPATQEVDVGEVKGVGVAGVDDFKADVSGLSTFDPATDEVDVGEVKGVGVAGVDDFKADVSGLSTFDPAADEVDVGKVDGVSLAGKVGRNFDFFFQNSGADTTKEVDDVGGGSGLTDWTASERTEIRQALGVTGTKAATSGGNLDAVKAKTDNLPADPAGISDLAALALEATAQAIKAKTDNLPADPAGISDLAALALEATAQAIKAKTDNLPADPAAVSDLTALALEATSQLIKAKTDNLPADPAATGDEMALTAAAIAAVVIALRDAKWTAGGVHTVSDILLAVFAMARGNVYKDGSDYKVYDDDDTGSEDGTLLFTLTLTAGTNERISS